MAKIAISYRRTDSDVTGRIFDRFVQRYGKDSVFRDIDNIPFGIDFRKVVNDALRGTDVLIAIVGPNWRGTRKQGGARINDANDLVRIEVETALERNIPVIPALVGGAMMPKPTELPDGLRDFSFRNAANIDSGRNFDTDIERLMRSMDRLLEGKTGETRPAKTTSSDDAERITVPTVRFEEPIEEPTAAPAASLDQSIESEGVAERFKAPSHHIALIGVLLGVVAVVAVSIWAVFRLPTTAVRESVPLPAEREWALKPKDVFKECATCPEMVVVPAGSFTMGSPADERWHEDSESPQHAVTFSRQVAVGRFALTFDEWDACAADGGCEGYRPDDEGWGRERRPVINVSWDDAKEYAAWLSRRTGKTYRLLSEAEREYVTRAGTTTLFWWGNSISTSQANYDGRPVYDRSQGEFRQKTLPVHSFQPNLWGVYQVHGNVREWVEDCWNNNYQGAPSDGSAWTRPRENCRQRVVRGGSWRTYPQALRSAARFFSTDRDRDFAQGFRVGRTLTP
jgi:formylglycine-generating enzyme required for sulfatase activity